MYIDVQKCTFFIKEKNSMDKNSVSSVRNVYASYRLQSSNHLGDRNSSKKFGTPSSTCKYLLTIDTFFYRIIVENCLKSAFSDKYKRQYASIPRRQI